MQANPKQTELYLAFAKAAEQEGFPQIAKLFKAAAEAETVHAHNHLRVLGQVKTTADNLSTAVHGETYEFTKMYPQLIEDAKAEGNKKAVQSFDYANKVEAIHADLYKKAIDSVKAKKDLPAAEIYMCAQSAETHSKATHQTSAQFAELQKLNSRKSQ